MMTFPAHLLPYLGSCTVVLMVVKWRMIHRALCVCV